jgi:hypothetical protein
MDSDHAQLVGGNGSKDRVDGFGGGSRCIRHRHNLSFYVTPGRHAWGRIMHRDLWIDSSPNSVQASVNEERKRRAV